MDALASSRPLPWRRYMFVGGVTLVQLMVACSASRAQVAAIESAPAGTITSKLFRYAKRVVKRYDTNGDGRLDEAEWTSMRGNPATADLNRDSQITIDEFARFVASYGAGRRIRLSATRDPIAERNPIGRQPGVSESEAANADQLALERRRGLKYFSQLPDGVPSWFVERDADGDAQLTLAEFSPKLRAREVAEFKGYDVNGDGLLTAAELSGRARKEGEGTPNPAIPASPRKPK